MVEEDDQFTHMIHIDGEHKGEEMLNVFKSDPDFMENEKNYMTIRKEILGESDDDSSSSSSDSSDSSDSDSDDDGQGKIRSFNSLCLYFRFSFLFYSTVADLQSENLSRHHKPTLMTHNITYKP